MEYDVYKGLDSREAFYFQKKLIKGCDKNCDLIWKDSKHIAVNHLKEGVEKTFSCFYEEEEDCPITCVEIYFNAPAREHKYILSIIGADDRGIWFGEHGDGFEEEISVRSIFKPWSSIRSLVVHRDLRKRKEF